MKTCEKCGKEKCVAGDETHIHSNTNVEHYCHGHESVTVPKDSWEEEFEDTWPKIYAWSEQREEYVDQTDALKSFIRQAVSQVRYEGAKGCAEAVSKAEVANTRSLDVSNQIANCVIMARAYAESLNPEKKIV